MKPKERWLSILLSLALLGAAAGCSQGQAPSDGGSSQSSVPQAGDTGEEAPGEGGEEEPEYETVIYSYNGARWSLEKLMRNASDVVHGTVTEGEMVVVDGANGGSTVFSDYTVEVEDVLRGNVEPGSSITVRRNGAPGVEGVVFEGEAEFEKDGEYLIFLQSRDGVGGDFATADNPPTVLGAQSGLFQRAETDVRDGGQYFVCQMDVMNGTAATTAERLAHKAQSMDGVVELSQLKAELEEVNQAYPPNPYALRDELLYGATHNYETGFVSKEEYEQMVEGLEECGGTVVSREPLW